MPSNTEAAEIFRGIADLLDVMGERFKPEAYRRAARSLESLTEDLSAVAARGELRSIPGVGEAIEEKLREYLASGKIAYYDRLRLEVPPGVAEMLAIPGLGPKTARRFWVELGIETPDELLAALTAGRLSGVKGFGEKKVAQIRSAVEGHRAGPAGARLPIEVAYPIAQALVQGLRERAGAEQIEVAGSFRRGRETVGDLDLLVTSVDPTRAFDVFSSLPEVREVRLRGATKETVLLTNGLQVDLRVVEPAAFGAALQYFTGSKDHNVIVRSLAKERGLRVNEYGVYRGDERLAGRTEEEVYAALGLAWIPPELREARGEVDLAAQGPLPPLVSESALRGDLHVHLAPDAEAASVEPLVTSARARGLAYLGLVAEGLDDHGRPFTLPSKTQERLRKAAGPKLRLHLVREVDVPSGPTSAGREVFDWTVLRPTSRAPNPPPASVGRAWSLAVVAHVGSRDPAGAEAARAWIQFARAVGTAVEVGPGPERLDSTWARSALETGLSLALPTGVEEPTGSPTGPIALRFARRAGAGPGQVRNADPHAPVSGGRKAAAD
ncbi:MAG: helix-hairpin-helix domain-containing protein [Thermoplasmata archaeon]|nr:helix-hairpin-helix domain-containing protein [Thermoplasmata archaeon]